MAKSNDALLITWVKELRDKLLGTTDMGSFTGSTTGSLGEQLDSIHDSLSVLGGGAKQASNYYVLPAGPGAGVTLTKSGTANTYGIPASVGTTLGASYLVGIVPEDFSAANNYAQIMVDTSPSFQAVSSLAAATTSPLTITAPTCTDNDILIAAVMYSSATPADIAPPNGWTAFIDQEAGGTIGAWILLAWKRAELADSGANFDFTTTGSPNPIVGNISAWRGCVTTGSPLSGTATLSPNASADTVTYADFTPSNAGDKVVAIGFYRNDLTTAGDMSGGDPVFANHWDQETSTGADASIFGYGGVSVGGAAIGARTHSTTSTADAESIGVMFGLVGDGGGAVTIKVSAPATAATGSYTTMLPIPAEVPGGARTIFATWAGNTAVADTMQLSLILALQADVTDMD